MERALEKGDALMKRIFTEREQAYCNKGVVTRYQCFAARFAAKEAAAKALGTGIGAVGWQEIEVLRGPNQEPTLHLHGAAEKLAAELGLETWSVSLSHTHEHAVALVVAVGDV